MHRYLSRLSIFACLLLVFGCGIAAKQEWSENYALTDGVRATSPQMIDGNPRTFGESSFPEGSQGLYGPSPPRRQLYLAQSKGYPAVVIHSGNLGLRLRKNKRGCPASRQPLH